MVLAEEELIHSLALAEGELIHSVGFLVFSQVALQVVVVLAGAEAVPVARAVRPWVGVLAGGEAVAVARPVLSWAGILVGPSFVLLQPAYRR